MRPREGNPLKHRLRKDEGTYKLKKIHGTPAGCPWDTWQDRTEASTSFGKLGLLKRRAPFANRDVGWVRKPCDPEVLLQIPKPGKFQRHKKVNPFAKSPHRVLRPCVSKQCPADGVWRTGRGVSPDQTGFKRHGLPPQRAPLDTVYLLREHLNSVQRMVSGGYCEGLFPDTVCWTRLRNTWLRERHRGGCSFTSCFQVSGPFFQCSKMSLFYLKTCTPVKGTS